MSFRHFPSRPVRARSRIPRALASVLLGLQALLWGGGYIVEAKAAAESLSRYTHVEDQSTTACPPIHSHLDCLICRTLNGGAVGGSAPAFVPVALSGSECPASDAAALVVRGIFGTLGSRGPPGI